jgi:anti-sigma-K factor RskA
VFVVLVGGSLYVKYAGQGAAPADQLADQAVRDLADRLGNLQQLERMLNSGNVKLASLTPANSRDHASAYVVWDYPSKQWHFYALGLPPAPAGQTYQLWAVADESEPLAGPTFTVDAEGVGGAVADFPTLAPQAAVKAVVTLEPAGGSKTPTGDPLLEAPL